MFGPSLPPGVVGPSLGLLVIRMHNSSENWQTTNGPTAVIKAASFHLYGTEAALQVTEDQSVELPLVGSVSSVEKYLNDASPFQIVLMGKSNRQIGFSTFPRLSLTDLNQNNPHEPIFTRKYQLNEFVSEQSQHTLEYAVFEIAFHVGPVRRQKHTILSDKVRSICEESKTRDTADYYSVFDELLDLCDGATIPTLNDTCNTSTIYPDPYQPWLANIQRDAASPPRKYLKMHIHCITIPSNMLNSLGGTAQLYLGYTIKSGSTESTGEFLVSEHSCSKSNFHLKKKCVDEQLILVDSPHGNEIIIADDSESIDFCLFYKRTKPPTSMSKSVCASMEFEKKSTCLSTAFLDLCATKLDSNGYVTLDLMTAKTSAKSGGIKAGNLSVCLLHLSPDATSPAARNDEEVKPSESAIPFTYDRGQSSEPHPVSLFLSRFASRSQAMKEWDCSPAVSGLAIQTDMHEESSSALLPQEDAERSKKFVMSQLQQVRPPPLWMGVVVSRIELTTPVNAADIMLSCDHANSPIGTPETAFDGQWFSWQFSLKDRGLEQIDMSIYLTREDPISSVVHVHFNVQITFEYEFPFYIKSEWFDVKHSESSCVGRIKVELAISSLKRIRSFPTQCMCAIFLQRWWRKMSTMLKESFVATENHSTSKSATPPNQDNSSSTNEPINENGGFDRSGTYEHSVDNSGGSNSYIEVTKQSQPSEPAVESRDDLGAVQTIRGLVGRSICVYQSNVSPSSSPDSVFEEWSRQSIRNKTLSVSKELTVPHSRTAALEIAHATSRADPPTTNIDDGEQGLNSPEQLDERTQCSHLQRNEPFDPPANDADCPPFNVADECGLENTKKSLIDELEQIESPVVKKDDVLDLNASSFEQMEIVINLLRVGGLNNVVSRWCKVNSTTVLPVSGLFISCCNSCDTTSEEHERTIIRSRLISMQEIHRELSFNDLKSTISIVDYESDLAKIREQSLIISLSWLPVMTRAVVAAFSRPAANASINDYSFSGCRTIAFAIVPLYHLYTPQSHFNFDRRVEWEVAGRAVVDSFIKASVHRVNDGLDQCDRKSSCERLRIDPPICSSSNKRVRAEGNLQHPDEMMTCRGLKRSKCCVSVSRQSFPAPLTYASYSNVNNLAPANDVGPIKKSESVSTAPESAPLGQERKEDVKCNKLTTPSQPYLSQPVQTCERASSPVLLAVRYADAGVGTSPCRESANNTFELSPEPTIERDSSESEDVTEVPCSHEAKQAEPCVNKNISTSQSSEKSTPQVNSGTGLRSSGGFKQHNACPNNTRPQRIRSRLMQGYFSSPRASYGAVESLRSMSSPPINQYTTNMLHRNTVLFGGTTMSQTSESRINHVTSAVKRRDEPSAASPTMPKPLSNREPIERIFSGKK